MRTSPGFAIPLMLLVALGAAVNAASFGALHALLWKPLPYAQPGQLVELRMDLHDVGVQVGLSHALYALLREDSDRFSGAVGSIAARPQLDAAGREWQVQRITLDFAEVLGVAPTRGRSLLQAGQPDTLLLSSSAARQRFGSTEAALGQRLRLNESEYTVVGVMPAGFSYPDAGVDAWMPYLETAAEREQDAMGGFGMFGVSARLAPGASVRDAEASLAAVLANTPLLAGLRDSGATVRADVRGWRERYSAGHTRAISLLQVAALLLLAVVTANLANLLLFRVLARQHEFAVRRSVGAGTLDLMRSLLAELWRPTALALAAGCALSPLGSRLMQHLGLLPAALPDAFGAPLVGPAWALASSLLAIGLSLLLALPALRAQAGLERGLRERAHRVRMGRGRGALLIAQVALATVVVGGAGLLLRSAQNLAAESRGFDARHVLMSSIDLQALTAAAEARGEADPQAVVAAAGRRIGEHLERLPSVVGTAYADAMPFGSSHYIAQVRPPADGADLTVRTHGVSTGFFAVMGMPLLAGRDFGEGESAADEVVVDALLAKQLFGGRSPVGHTLRIAEGEGFREATIVGLVPTVKYKSLDEAPTQAAIYEPLRTLWDFHYRVTRTAGDPAGLLDATRLAVLKAAPDAVLGFHRPLAEAVEASVAGRRALLQLAGLIALVALLLAGIGLHALLGLSVAERRAEIGVRLALGASAARILRLVFAQGLRLVLPGVLLGTVLGVGAAHFLADELFRVEPDDLAAWLLAVLGVAVVALIASLMPARTAASVPPNAALGSQA